MFGVVLKSGVTFYSMLLDDKHPQELFKMFGTPVGNSFRLVRRDLIVALDRINVVMGNNETGVIWDMVENGFEGLTWKLSCKTYKGAEIAENVFAPGSGDFPSSFGVHRKALIEALKAFDKSVEVVEIFPDSGTFIYVVAGRYVVALTKMAS